MEEDVAVDTMLRSWLPFIQANVESI